VLSGEIHLRMYNTKMSSKSIITRKELFLRTKGALELEFADVVDGILVTCKIIRP